MKRIKRLAIILICALLFALSARAEANLSGVIEGSRMRISWSAGCEGTAQLTVYQNGWPICVRSVNCSDGGALIELGRISGRYSLRLKTPYGCLTADVRGSAVETEIPKQETPAPTPESTPVPTAESTIEPTKEPTNEPTLVPTAEPAPVPTRVPATATPKPTATPVAASNRSDLASEVISQVNAERAKYGLNPLSVSGELTRAACVRASEIVEQFSHTRPDGSSWSTVSMSAFGENIAKGQRTADRVMAAWMSSTGHRENILRPSYGSIGVCAYVTGGVTYWVQLFGH